ncbi:MULTISPECIES: putative metalloprotease CJM1_0395 family protein [unclassified Pseudomonas]|uniref:putative metalloprotease CJM1_0395 family protein n=1 Tax=unclassified Pseudomonas TaxID=196821 RepID=UPI00244CCD83|nr:MULTISPECIES: putative metalloprotease CJM1_0395 family protein [unclassified Pseudomonas]MDG9925943.1 putative metalloprotease CJM1_0395 family protein [Pseudomonas sp. GD04045]MDH0034847.1 putative metalloprotease CJM1_0395 family protein [Pseudomonas sp. GD04019]
MQIGSAMTYAAPLPSSQAARTPSSELSRPADPAAKPLAGAESPELRDEAKSPALTDAEGEEESPRETQQLRQEQLEIAELASRDREVRAHEQAHASVGGSYAGAPTYTFKRGPDGKSYAVGGEVSIDTSPIPGDPEATLRKMELVQRAALAPAEPSAQDLRVAAEAAAQATQARAELAELRREEAVAAAEERATRREEQLAEEGEKAAREEEEKPQQAATPPRLDLYLRLAQLQAPLPAVDLRV